MIWLEVLIIMLERVVKKMNRKGFTLIELLAVLAVIGLVAVITFYLIKGTMATSLTQIDTIEEQTVYEAANNYVIEQNKPYNRKGYVCVTTQELIDFGYLKKTDDTTKIIKLTRNNITKVVEEIKYVDECK